MGFVLEVSEEKFDAKDFSIIHNHVGTKTTYQEIGPYFIYDKAMA